MVAQEDLWHPSANGLCLGNVYLKFPWTKEFEQFIVFEPCSSLAWIYFACIVIKGNINMKLVYIHSFIHSVMSLLNVNNNKSYITA